MPTQIVYVKKKKFRRPILFAGLPGIGLVGKITVDYLLKQLKTEKIAEIYSDTFPPSVHTQNGILELIKDEVFAITVNKQDFLFLAGPVQPALNVQATASEGHYEFAEKIISMCKELGVKEIYTLAGINIGDARMEKEPEVVIAATSEKLFKEWKLKPNGKGGLISGAAGLVLGLARIHHLEGACLMGETNAKLIYGDHGAAKTLIELLKKRYGFKVDMAGIKRESKNIEEAFAQLTKQLEQRAKEVAEEDPEEKVTYVR